MASNRRPWIQCPCCWIPIEIPPNEEVGEHECQNPTCPLSTLKVRVKVFKTREEAHVSQKAEESAFLIGEVDHFINSYDMPVNFWGYFYCSQPIDRFRLLEGKPLSRLVSKEFIANWELGVATKTEPRRPITTYMIEYERETGLAKRNNDATIQLTPISPAPNDLLVPSQTHFCDVCLKIRDQCRKLSNVKKEYVDPCINCNGKLAEKVFQQASNEQEELRLAAAYPRRASKKLFECFHHVCWLGLLDMVFPVIVADIIVGVVFTGQLRLKDTTLSPEHEDRRDEILSDLGLSKNDILKQIGLMKEVSIVSAKKIWQELRNSVHQLQIICASRYGQMGAVRERLLSDRLRNTIRQTDTLAKTKARVLSLVGNNALKELATFFSFQRASMLIQESGQWEAVASWGLNYAIQVDLPIVIDVDLSSEDGDIPSQEQTEQIRKVLWPDIYTTNYYYWVRGNSETWYLFMVRRFEKNDEPRARLNRFTQHLVREITLIFHQEASSLLWTHQQIENFRHIVHNLGGPGAELGSALTNFDARAFRGQNLMKMTALGEEYKFLKDSIQELCDDVERARKRIAFEVRKFETGIDIDKELAKKTIKIPIFDAHRPLEEGPLGFWDKALWSFEMYSRELSLRRIKIERDIKKKDLYNQSVRANENVLQIVLDNIADNAVKYAYEDTEINLSISCQEIEKNKYCEISVSNYGNGILKHEINKVWDRLFRGTCSTTRTKQVSGSGLGLFIVKKVVEYYKGKVEIESDFGGEINYNIGEGFNTKIHILLPIL